MRLHRQRQLVLRGVEIARSPQITHARGACRQTQLLPSHRRIGDLQTSVEQYHATRAAAAERLGVNPDITLLVEQQALQC